MSSVVNTINNAQKAIEIGNTLTGTSGANQQIPINQSSSWKNMHWSTYLVAVGAVAALAAGIAMTVLAQYAMTIVCAVLFGIQIIGAYYLKESGPYRALAAIADQFAIIVTKISQNQRQIQQSNQLVQKTNHEIAQTNQQIKGVLNQADNQINNTDGVINKIKETSNQNTKVLATSQEKLQKDLQDTRDQLAQMTLLYSNVQTQVVQLKKTVQQYEDAENLISKDAAILSEASSRMNKPSQEEQERRRQLLGKARDFHTQLQTGISNLENTLGDNLNNGINAAVKNLDEENQEFSDNVRKVEKVEQGLEIVKKDIEDSIEKKKQQSNQLAEFLEALQKATNNAETPANA